MLWLNVSFNIDIEGRVRLLMIYYGVERELRSIDELISS
jgi:hypothetical protein